MNRYAHIVFCDDIRQEVGGKITQVGIYTGKCLVPTMPCTLPKLCFSLTLGAPKTDPINSVSVSAFYAGIEVASISLNSDQIKEIMASNPPSNPTARKHMTLTLMGIISPFTLTTPGRIKFTIAADDRELICDDLEIEIDSPEPQN